MFTTAEGVIGGSIWSSAEFVEKVAIHFMCLDYCFAVRLVQRPFRAPPLAKISWNSVSSLAPVMLGSFARGRCRRGRSEIPHFCSKLLLFALVL